VLLERERTRIKKQRGVGRGERRRHLIHDADRRADPGVR